jgi:iron complex outermembrane receptor protein
MKKNLVLLLVLMSSLLVFGQQSLSKLRGRILTSDGYGVSVFVKLARANKSTVSGDNGEFEITGLSLSTDTLIVSSAESLLLRIPVIIAREEGLDLGDIHLTSKIGELATVDVYGHIMAGKYMISSFANKISSGINETPQAVSVISKQAITEKMAFTLKDIADDVAGVNQYSGFDEYTIRGFRADNPHYLNGLRGYRTTFVNTMLLNIEKIEVIKGPAASLYGNCDPGGTINLVTKNRCNPSITA